VTGAVVDMDMDPPQVSGIVYSPPEVIDPEVRIVVAADTVIVGMKASSSAQTSVTLSSLFQFDFLFPFCFII